MRRNEAKSDEGTTPQKNKIRYASLKWGRPSHVFHDDNSVIVHDVSCHFMR